MQVFKASKLTNKKIWSIEVVKLHKTTKYTTLNKINVYKRKKLFREEYE